jgi:hypothetical protein
MIKFTPRTSHFDTTNELSGVNEFRVGHFTLTGSCRCRDRSSSPTGIFHVVLDFDVYFCNSNIHKKPRDERICSESHVCRPLFQGCDRIGAQ